MCVWNGGDDCKQGMDAARCIFKYMSWYSFHLKIEKSVFRDLSFPHFCLFLFVLFLCFCFSIQRPPNNQGVLWFLFLLVKRSPGEPSVAQLYSSSLLFCCCRCCCSTVTDRGTNRTTHQPSPFLPAALPTLNMPFQVKHWWNFFHILNHSKWFSKDAALRLFI